MYPCFRYTEVQKHMFRLKDKSSTADRIVPAQPLAFYNKQGKLTRYNLRKFSELPFQLIRCYRFKVSPVNKMQYFMLCWGSELREGRENIFEI